MSTDHLRRALAESRDCLDAGERWGLVFRAWWRWLWRMVLVGGVLNAAAGLVFSTGVGESRAGNAIGGVIWLLVSLWAVRRMVAGPPWPWVLRCWWALFWRLGLVGGVVFAAASWGA